MEPRKNKRWTKAEDDYIREFFWTVSGGFANQLAVDLGRSEMAVIRRARTIGWIKPGCMEPTEFAEAYGKRSLAAFDELMTA